MLILLGKKSQNNDTKSCVKVNNIFSRILKILFYITFITAILFSLLLASDVLFDLRAGRKTLVVISIIAELIALFKTMSTDIPKILSKEEVDDITYNGKLRNSFRKIIIVFGHVMKTQLLLIVPFFIAYAMFNTANIAYFFNCVITIIGLGIIIAVWAIVVHGAFIVIKKCKPNIRKFHEFVIFAIFLLLSIYVLFTCKKFNFESFLFKFFDLVGEGVYLVQTFVMSLNRNFMLCISILALLLITLGIIKVLFKSYKTDETYVNDIAVKKVYWTSFVDKKYENVILRSCLARSPTLV